MSRFLRITIPGTPHHVTQRGNRRQTIFFCQQDFKMYLRFLELASIAHDFAVWSYCLMTNHVHLLVVPKDGKSLSNGIAQVHYAYSKYLNNKMGWKGQLWQGRFYSCPLELERAKNIAQYIELNPVRAKMVEFPWHYPWSSASDFADNKILEPKISNFFEGSTSEWREFLLSGIPSSTELDDIRKAVRVGRIFGSKNYVVNLEAKFGCSFSPQKRGPKFKSKKLQQ